MIVTFYSFKGGVGRSMALANVARWLYDNGLRVVVVDWDLEAPGVENYFAQDEAQSKLRAAPGLMDLILSYQAKWPSLPWPALAPDETKWPYSERGAVEAAETVKADLDAIERDRKAAEADLEARRLEVVRQGMPPLGFALQALPGSPPPPDNPNDGRRKPGLWILTAGRRDAENFPRYADAVQMFDWSGFYNKMYGGTFFEWLRESLEQIADVVLIDSRTGVTEMSGVCTRHLADLVVSMCAPNESNLAGMERSIQLLRSVPKELRGGRELEILAIPTRVDLQAESVTKTRWGSEFVERVGSALSIQDAQHLWNLKIPYVPRYSFSEKLVFGDPDGEELLISAYSSLGEAIARHLSRTMSIERRRSVLSRVRRPDSIIRTLFVSPEADGEAAWSILPEEQRNAAQRLLLRLVRVSQAGSEDSVAIVMEDNLPEDERELARSASLSALVAGREVGDMLAFELSFKQVADWRRLKDWVDADREFLLKRQQLDGLSATWLESRRDEGALLGGTALDQFETLARSRPTEFLPVHREFLDRSRAHELVRDIDRLKIAQATQLEEKAEYYKSRVIRGRTFTLITWALLAVFVGLWAGTRTEAPPTPPQAIDTLALARLAALAEEALNAGKADAALTHAQEIIRVSVRDPRGYYLRARALALSSDAEDAAAQKLKRLDAKIDFDKAIELGAPAEGFLEAARNLIQLGLDDAAMSTLERGTIRFPRDSSLCLAIGQLHAKNKDSTKAQAAYTKAIENDPTNGLAYYERGRLLADSGDKQNLPQARSDLENAVRLSDKNTQQAASAVLARIGQARTIAPPRVYVQFNPSDPPNLAEATAGSLRRSGLHVAAVQPRPEWVVGDVRYYFPEDAPAAANIAERVESTYAQLGERLKLRVRLMENLSAPADPKQGAIEVWLPPQKALLK